MGYYTCYNIAFEGDENEIESFKKDLLDLSKDDDGDVAPDLKELLDYSCTDSKLYDLEEWISKVALEHPDVLVVLTGDGEESDDLWEARWKGDKYERKNAIIPPFETPELTTEYEKKHKQLIFNNYD